jgi:kinetochore protein Mis13/DSN1
MSEEAVIPVPERETPMIRKNKELREAQRRSSLSMRGQRASSSLGRGEISASKPPVSGNWTRRQLMRGTGIPHPNVDSGTFWKHITPTLPEPIKARHLLVWCAKRALDSNLASPAEGKGKEKAKRGVAADAGVRTEEGDRLIKEIMEEFMANLGKGVVDTNIFAQAVNQRALVAVCGY